jgi:CheY-like chemotaxis protein
MSITDTGMGMDQDVLKNVFVPFYTTKGREEGTGMGLATAYGTVRAHGGGIIVYSEKGSGTTFSIVLPATDNEMETFEEKMQDDDIYRGSETILIVDDEEKILQVNSDVLKNLGYNVITAKSGQDTAIIFMNQFNEIDLVLLDMIMPGMGGKETMELMQQIHPEAKVVLISGYTMDSKVKDVMKRGCRGFIQKPFNIAAAMSKAIRDVLEGQIVHHVRI